MTTDPILLARKALEFTKPYVPPAGKVESGVNCGAQDEHARTRPIVEALLVCAEAAKAWVATDEMVCPACSIYDAPDNVPCICDVIVDAQLETYAATRDALAKLASAAGGGGFKCSCGKTMSKRGYCSRKCAKEDLSGQSYD